MLRCAIWAYRWYFAGQNPSPIANNNLLPPLCPTPVGRHYSAALAGALRLRLHATLPFRSSPPRHARYRLCCLPTVYYIWRLPSCSYTYLPCRMPHASALAPAFCCAHTHAALGRMKARRRGGRRKNRGGGGSGKVIPTWHTFEHWACLYKREQPPLPANLLAPLLQPATYPFTYSPLHATMQHSVGTRRRTHT